MKAISNKLAEMAKENKAMTESWEAAAYQQPASWQPAMAQCGWKINLWNVANVSEVSVIYRKLAAYAKYEILNENVINQ